MHWCPFGVRGIGPQSVDYVTRRENWCVHLLICAWQRKLFFYVNTWFSSLRIKADEKGVWLREYPSVKWGKGMEELRLASKKDIQYIPRHFRLDFLSRHHFLRSPLVGLSGRSSIRLWVPDLVFIPMTKIILPRGTCYGFAFCHQIMENDKGHPIWEATPPGILNKNPYVTLIKNISIKIL